MRAIPAFASGAMAAAILALTASAASLGRTTSVVERPGGPPVTLPREMSLLVSPASLLTPQSKQRSATVQPQAAVPFEELRLQPLHKLRARVPHFETQELRALELRLQDRPSSDGVIRWSPSPRQP
ncbi:MAG TPA: hypothetical protein VHF69_04750 [Candidatus Synoicihabitans sp.]|nr:hypothetical protein [Candidatus Synoicihabitans sp.]